MITVRKLLPALLLTTGLVGACAYAEAQPADDAGALVAGGHGHHHGGPFMHVLKQLNLTAGQQTQLKSIWAQARTQHQSLHESMRANHESLMAADPSDANYPALLATEKANAAARVQMMSDIKSQVYAVLTPEQRAQIPALLASEQSARAAKFAQWHGQH